MTCSGTLHVWKHVEQACRPSAELAMATSFGAMQLDCSQAASELSCCIPGQGAFSRHIPLLDCSIPALAEACQLSMLGRLNEHSQMCRAHSHLSNVL